MMKDQTEKNTKALRLWRRLWKDFKGIFWDKSGQPTCYFCGAYIDHKADCIYFEIKDLLGEGWIAEECSHSEVKTGTWICNVCGVSVLDVWGINRED